MKNEKGQVSLETLLLATVVIMLSLVIFSHYLQIVDTTTAMQIAKLETIKQVEESERPYTIELIEYKIDSTGPVALIDFCITTQPAEPEFGLNGGIIREKIAGQTSFEEANITITHNDSSPCN